MSSADLDENGQAAALFENDHERLIFTREGPDHPAGYIFSDRDTGYVSCYMGPEAEVLTALRESFGTSPMREPWRIVHGEPVARATGLWDGKDIPGEP